MGRGRTAIGALALALVAMTVGYFVGVSFHEPQVAQAHGQQLGVRVPDPGSAASAVLVAVHHRRARWASSARRPSRSWPVRIAVTRCR